MDRFELGLVRRLRAELDALDVRLPAPAYGRRGSRRRPAFGLIRPLAIAAAAVIALAALATAVTRSPDPALWVQPSVWMHAFGVGPSSATPTTSQPDEAMPASPEAKPSTEPANAEPEPSETPGTSPREHESPEPSESESPSGGGSSPPGGEGPDG